MSASPRTAGPIFVENFTWTRGAPKHYHLAVVLWPNKLIYDEEGSAFELYDLQRDPGETMKLPLYGDVARTLRGHLIGYMENAIYRGGDEPGIALTPRSPEPKASHPHHH